MFFVMLSIDAAMIVLAQFLFILQTSALTLKLAVLGLSISIIHHDRLQAQAVTLPMI